MRKENGRNWTFWAKIAIAADGAKEGAGR